MRTVSFSSAPVQQLLNEDFICATINTEGDPTAGMSLGHAPTDSCGSSSRGIGEQNVQCLFLSSNGRILHVASGYVGPNDLEKEIRFAKKVHQAVIAEPENGKAIVVKLHKERLKTLGFSKEGLQSPRQRLDAKKIVNRFRKRMSIPDVAGFQGGRSRFGMLRQQARENAERISSARRNRMRRVSGRSRIGRRRTSQPSTLVPGIGSTSRFANVTKTMRKPSQEDVEKLLQGDGDDFNPTRTTGIFSFKAKRTVLNDHRFSIERPLYPMDDFLDDPRVLVGNRKSAYASVGPGGASGGRIGGSSRHRLNPKE